MSTGITLSRKDISLVNAARFIAPLAAGFLASHVCPIDPTSAETVGARPDPTTFTIVWIILYLLIGFTWVQAAKLDKHADIYFIILNLLLVGWIYFYSCQQQKKFSIYFILIASTLTFIMIQRYPGLVGHFLSPLFIWLLYAIILVALELQE